MTASRTITLDISDWAKIEEIRQFRDIKEVKDAFRYVIRADWSIVKAKRDNTPESPLVI